MLFLVFFCSFIINYDREESTFGYANKYDESLCNISRVQISSLHLRNYLTFKTDKNGVVDGNIFSYFSWFAAPVLSYYFGYFSAARSLMEMGKKFNASVKLVGKKLRNFEEYIPLVSVNGPVPGIGKIPTDQCRLQNPSHSISWLGIV